MKFHLSNHARQTMAERGILEEFVQTVLHSPQQIVEEKGGRKAHQSQLDFGGGRVFLVRAIVAEAGDEAVVVTVYRTKKIEKYWRKQ